MCSLTTVWRAHRTPHPPLHRRRPRFSCGGGSGVERFAFLCDLVTIAGNVQEEPEDWTVR